MALYPIDAKRLVIVTAAGPSTVKFKPEINLMQTRMAL